MELLTFLLKFVVDHNAGKAAVGISDQMSVYNNSLRKYDMV
jgi:hypothetical protein